jgi:hypothetical protein
MATFFRLLLGYMWDCFRSHERLKAEILIVCTENLSPDVVVMKSAKDRV